MVQLPPTEFTYGRYNMSAVPWVDIRTTADYISWLLRQNIIGFCDSAECEIRPRSDDMAVMFEDDSYQYWVHIPKDIWKGFEREVQFLRR